MFLLRSKTKAPPLHQAPPDASPLQAAIAKAAARADAQMAVLQRLAELATELALLAARRAKTELADPVPDPDPVPLEEAEPDHLYYPCPTEPPRPPAREPLTQFDRLSRNIRACFRLESQIAAQQIAALRPITDPRRPILRRALRPFVGTIPPDGFYPAGPTPFSIDEAVDKELKADPDRTTPLPELLALICEELELSPDEIALQPILSQPTTNDLSCLHLQTQDYTPPSSADFRTPPPPNLPPPK
jgi:hypothetical protein